MDFGTLPQWVAAVSSTGMLALVGLIFRLVMTDKTNLRAHTDTELLRLQNRIVHLEQNSLERERAIDERWRAQVKEVEDAHKICQNERDELREQLRGLARQFAQFQRAVATAIPPSPEIQKALEDLAQLEKDKGATR